MELRATKTSSMGCVNSCWCSRKLSRSNRRARLRSTAPPIFLLVTIPNFGLAPADNLFQFAIRQPCASRSPCCRTRPKSRFCASRKPRPRRRRFGDSAVMREKLNRCQAFAAFAAAVAQRGASTLGGFAGKKSMLTFAPDFRWLILAFHKFIICALAKTPLKERERLSANRDVSI